MTQSHSSNGSGTEISKLETQLYSRRWWLMWGIAVQTLLYTVSMLYFGVNNDVFSDYFDLPFALIDWFFIICKVANWLSSVGLAFVAIFCKTGFRKLAIGATSLTMIGSVCQFIAYTYPSLYGFMYIGNFLFGIVGGFILIIPMSFAVLWFPDNEIGSAISIRFATARLGFLIAFLVPSHILTPLECNNNNNSLNSPNITEDLNNSQCKQAWIGLEKLKLLTYVGTILTIAVLLLLYFVILATDQPPKPPTIAQARLRHISEQDKTGVWEKMKEFFSNTKILFTDVTFLLLVALVGILYAFNLYQSLFLSEIFRPVFQTMYTISEADILGGYLITGFELAAIFGTVLNGQIVNRIKDYVLLVRVGLSLCILCSIGLIVSYCFRNVSGIFISNIAFGMSSSMLFIPLYELSTQHTYPQRPEFVVSCLTYGYLPIVILVLELGRIILNQFGELSLLIFQASYLGTALLFTVFLKPKYRRLEAETFSETENLSTETSHLLSQSEDAQGD